eukprot:scaffold541383_cov43-Prasinocladus_malaysianus.AAC.1
MSYRYEFTGTSGTRAVRSYENELEYGSAIPNVDSYEYGCYYPFRYEYRTTYLIPWSRTFYLWSGTSTGTTTR